VYGFAAARLVLAGRDCPDSVARAIATAMTVSEMIPPVLRIKCLSRRCLYKSEGTESRCSLSLQDLRWGSSLSVEADS
jgi:hypothetical protein